MFERVVEYLEGGASDGAQRFENKDVRAAVAALFFHMIFVDGEVTRQELATLKLLLTDKFHLSSEQVDHLCREGVAEEKASATLFPFTTILNRALSPKERRDLISNLQSLAYADGVLHPLESRMIGQVTRLLNLN